MLTKSIELNMMISKNKMTYAFAAFIAAWFIFTPIMFVVFAVLVILTFYDLFCRSMTGEGAYTYMSFPISAKCMILGKTITLCFWVMLFTACMMIITILFSTPLSEVNTELSFGGSFLVTQVMVELSEASSSAMDYGAHDLKMFAVRFCMMPIGLLSTAVLLCGTIQTAVMANHILDPRRNRPVVTLLMVICSAALFILLCVFAMGLPGIFIKEAGVAVEIAKTLMRFTLGGILLAIGIKLFEKRYNLF